MRAEEPAGSGCFFGCKPAPSMLPINQNRVFVHQQKKNRPLPVDQIRTILDADIGLQSRSGQKWNAKNAQVSNGEDGGKTARPARPSFQCQPLNAKGPHGCLRIVSRAEQKTCHGVFLLPSGAVEKVVFINCSNSFFVPCSGVSGGRSDEQSSSAWCQLLGVLVASFPNPLSILEFPCVSVRRCLPFFARKM